MTEFEERVREEIINRIEEKVEEYKVPHSKELLEVMYTNIGIMLVKNEEDSITIKECNEQGLLTHFFYIVNDPYRGSVKVTVRLTTNNMKVDSTFKVVK